VYELRNDKNRSFTDMLKVVIIELPKLPEEEDSAIWPWLRFLKCGNKEEYEMLAKKYPKLKKPINCVKRMGLIESIRYYQFHRNLAKVDERMLHEQWKEDGMAEGEAKQKLTIAKNALAEGSTPEFVQKITGLSIDEIAKL